MSKTKKEETCLHYDEAARFFPIEFASVFEKYGPKKIKVNQNEMNFAEYNRHNLVRESEEEQYVPQNALALNDPSHNEISNSHE